GTARVGGDYIQNRTGTLSIQVASPVSYDRLQVNGKAHLNGTLAVSLLNGYLPEKGDKFTILTAQDGVRGIFSAEDAPVWDNLTLRPVYGAHTVKLETTVA